jgi:hypothetical protein
MPLCCRTLPIPLSVRDQPVAVAHARNVRLIGESRRKFDRLGAQTLARLAPDRSAAISILEPRRAPAPPAVPHPLIESKRSDFPHSPFAEVGLIHIATDLAERPSWTRIRFWGNAGRSKAGNPRAKSRAKDPEFQ